MELQFGNCPPNFVNFIEGKLAFSASLTLTFTPSEPTSGTVIIYISLLICARAYSPLGALVIILAFEGVFFGADGVSERR